MRAFTAAWGELLMYPTNRRTTGIGVQAPTPGELKSCTLVRAMHGRARHLLVLSVFLFDLTFVPPALAGDLAASPAGQTFAGSASFSRLGRCRSRDVPTMHALTDAKVPCLTFESSDAVPVDSGAPRTEFSSHIVTEKRDLLSMLSISASLSASYGLTSGGGSVINDKRHSLRFRTVNLVLSAKSDYGRFSVNDVVLRPAYDNLSPTMLKAICGTNFISMERREAAVAAVFSFTSSSAHTRNELATALSASWSGGNFSANVSQKLQESLSNTAVTFTFLAKGGKGLSATSGFVTSFDQIESIRKEVAKYISTMSSD